MIVVTVFLSILKQIEFNLVQNLEEKKLVYHDHIPFKMKGNVNTFVREGGNLHRIPAVWNTASAGQFHTLSAESMQ